MTAQRNRESWMNGIIGPDTIKVDGASIATKRKSINLVGATAEDDPDNDQTNVTIPGSGGSGATPAGSEGDLQKHGSGGALAAIAPSTAGNQLIVNSSGAWVSGRWIAGACTLEQFGAVGDGTTSDQTAFAAAITALGAGTYKAIFLGAGKTYLVTGSHTLPAGCSIRGEGWSSVIKTTSNISVLVLGGEDCVVRDLQILGSGSGGAQVGIRAGTAGSAASGVARATIHNILFKDLAYAGLEYNENPFTTYAGPRVSSCHAEACGTGYKLGTRGEYISFSACVAESCTVAGLSVGAGNLSWTGGVITSCTKGVDIVAGTNDAHGIISGANINHNTKNVVVTSISNGFTFSGCHIYEGPIEIVSSYGVQFLGGTIDVTGYVLTTALGTRFEWVKLGTTYANTITESGGSTVSWIGSKTLSGTPASWLGRRASGIYTSGTDVYFGTDPSYTSASQPDTIRFYCKSTGYIYFGTGSNARAWISDTEFAPFVPITGGGVSNYGVHGVGTQAMSDASQTPSASVYQYGTIKTTGVITANRTLVLPTQTNATAVAKWIDNTCTGSFNIIVQDASGSGTTVTVPNGTRALVLHDARGATRLTPPFPNGTLGQILTSDGSFGYGTALTAPSGAIVGTTDAQTLSNKTIASPTVSGTPQYLVFDGPTQRGAIKTVVGYVSTSSTTPTTVASYTMSDETLVAFDAIVTCARRTNVTKGGRYKRSIVYRRTSGGAPTIVGSSESGTDQETTAGDDVAFDVSGNDILVKGTAADTDGRNWTCELRVQETNATT